MRSTQHICQSAAGHDAAPLPPFEDSTPKLPLSQTSVDQVLARRFVERSIATDVSEINGKGIVEGIEVISFLTIETRYASVDILFQPRDESQFLIRPRVSLNFVQRVVVEWARWTTDARGSEPAPVLPGRPDLGKPWVSAEQRRGLRLRLAVSW